MKKIIIAVALLAVLIAPIQKTQAQELVSLGNVTSTANLQQVYDSLLVQLINLLYKQLLFLQDQLAKMQAIPAAPAAPAVSTSTPAAPQVQAAPPAPVVRAADPVITASATPVENGQYRIEWLATQSDKNDLKCSSPEIGNIGTQGMTLRALTLPASFTFSCTDQVTLQVGSKTISVQ